MEIIEKASKDISTEKGNTEFKIVETDIDRLYKVVLLARKIKIDEAAVTISIGAFRVAEPRKAQDKPVSKQASIL